MRSPSFMHSFSSSSRQPGSPARRNVSSSNNPDLLNTPRSNFVYNETAVGTPPDSSAIRPHAFPMSNINASLPANVTRKGTHHRPALSTHNSMIKPQFPRADDDTPPEMVPILTLLTAHTHRQYFEGYFMLLNDLGNDGKQVSNRQWVEVYGMLVGSQLSMWKADDLDDDEDRAKPSYINITDATFKSITELPSPGGVLQNIIVLSTTMKNRYLLQFSTAKEFNEWTAALRLTSFEYTALQEAYTGALLSAKGAKLNGIRSLLGETKTKREDWCSVRFGAGMQWKRVWYVLTPVNLIKQKKDRKEGFGQISFYDNPKVVKKPPLATIVRLQVAHAIFPERSVLMNASSLIKCEGQVNFSLEEGVKDTAIFLMPEQHPGIQGFETLIRFIIPLMDAYKLYGRPSRLNADKNDLRSLLFAMPTLPHVYYLDILDMMMLSGKPESNQWTAKQWTNNIKEMLARKLATGFKGLGSIQDVVDRSVNAPPVDSRRSFIGSVHENFGAELSKTSPIKAGNDDLAPPNRNRPGNRAISQPNGIAGIRQAIPRSDTSSPSPADSTHRNLTPQRPVPSRPGMGLASSAAQSDESLNYRPQRGATGPRPQPAHKHERSASEGQDPNNLIVAPGQGPLTPMLNDEESQSSKSFSSSNFGTEASQGPSVFDPGFDGTQVPSHYSYAEYSEYMQAYLARGLEGPPPSDPAEIREMVDNYRSRNRVDQDPEPVPRQVAAPTHSQTQPQALAQAPPQFQRPPQAQQPIQYQQPMQQQPMQQRPPQQMQYHQGPNHFQQPGQHSGYPAPPMNQRMQGPGPNQVPPPQGQGYRPGPKPGPPGPGMATHGAPQWQNNNSPYGSSPNLNRPPQAGPQNPGNYPQQRQFDNGFRPPRPHQDLRNRASNDSLRKNGGMGPAYGQNKAAAARSQGPFGAAMAASSASLASSTRSANKMGGANAGPYAVVQQGAPRSGNNPYGTAAAAAAAAAASNTNVNPYNTSR